MYPPINDAVNYLGIIVSGTNSMKINMIQDEVLFQNKQDFVLYAHGLLSTVFPTTNNEL
jgi:hypothetical protein